MEEFLRDNYSLITKSVEALAAFTGLFCLNKFKNSPVKYFIWFLVYVLIVELLGSYTRYVENFEFLHGFRDKIEGTIFEKNNWFYCLFWVISSTILYSFFYQKILRYKPFIVILKWVTLCFLFYSFVYIITNLDAFFTTTISSIRIFNSIIILLCVVFYFIETLQSERFLTFYKSIYFYISATLLVYSLIITPLVFYNVYFSTADWNFIFLKQYIYLFANIFMYLAFAFALIYCKPEYD